ncbi:hypothetical protein DFP72DRAFT_854763 [Ephemerocybe angulata]|uniref:Fungal-type protein kinase domain-containing protein n=1 Tax=Ephemerocybe angulata TaxID=980116 RepID=A0A8H6LYU6_9AGAR|nr:hypothetical protein DFP72DRAFT_854763 [Tulosesus angulatus]
MSQLPQYRYQTRSRTRAQAIATSVDVVLPPARCPAKKTATRSRCPPTTTTTEARRKPKRTITPLAAAVATGTSPRPKKRVTRVRQKQPPKQTKTRQAPHPPVPAPLSQTSISDSDVFALEASWAMSLYNDLAEEARVELFLRKKSSGYAVTRGKGCWTQVPCNPHTSSDLSSPVVALVSQVIHEFAGPTENGVTRRALAVHLEDGPRGGESSVDVCIRATGPSFESSSNADGSVDDVGYTNIASIFHLEVDEQSSASMTTTQIMALRKHADLTETSYAPLVITESRIRLVHFDRGGIYITPFMNIHDNPLLFVRIVLGDRSYLGLTSSNEADLGLDTSVQWTIDTRTGKKVSGLVETTDGHGRTIAYPLRMDLPGFTRSEIVGRGTTCWFATDPEKGGSVVIKDAWGFEEQWLDSRSTGVDREMEYPPDRTIRRAPNKSAASLHWRSADRSPETEFLLAAQGIQGIIQMISYQDVCATTLDFHPALPEDPEIRVKLRIVMEKHGASVWNFTSRYQAIAAIRDAISAHKELLMRGVIHRDISAQNILLGRADAPDGLRGILIDLDMAMSAEGGSSLTNADPSTVRLNSESPVIRTNNTYTQGTRTYQSVSILMSADPENHPIPPHDYLDDLESFFYVTTHLILSFKGPGECVKSPPVFFSYWDDLDARTASASKSTLVRGGFHAHFFPAYWGEACKTLVRGFQVFIKAVINEKIEIRFSEIGEDERARRWDALVGEDLDTNYARVDELFRVALENIAAEDSKAVVPTKPSMPREAVNSRRNLKRMLGEETAEDPPRKRTRRRA